MVAGAVVVPSPPAQPRALTLLSACRDATGSKVDDEPGGRWTHGFTYGPENYTTGHVIDDCDTTTIDLPALAAPSGVTATPATTGGTIAAGTHGYRISATRGGGQTLASTTTTAVTTGSTSTVTLGWNAVYGADGYKVYGRTSGSELLMGTVTSPGFVDTGSVTPSGALPASNTTGGPGDYNNLAPVVFQPYAITALDKCSTFGFAARDYAGRALRQLDAVTPKQVEKEFWTGSLSQAMGYGNRYLTDGNAVDVTPTPGTAITREAGFEALEQALADCGYGPRGMIHCQPRVLAPPLTLGIQRHGNLLTTQLDTVVVPGVGYPGTSPNGSAPAALTTWIYATTMVDARLDAPVVIPDPSDADWRFQALDRNQNAIVMRAYRLAAATHDGPCVFACLITTNT